MAQESTISAQIYTALAAHLKRPVSGIHPEADLRTDLGLNSLDIVELLFKMEEAFDLEIPESDLSDITTVGALVGYMEQHLEMSTTAVVSAPHAVTRTDA